MLNLVDRFQRFRTRRIVRVLTKYIKPQEKVLDFGCGNMLITQAIRQRIGSNTVGVDVIDINRTEEDLILYNGQSLPFADNSFDVAYAAFVLHHTNNIEALVKECLRVTKKRLIILEDVYENSFELVLLKIFDWLGNRPFSGEMNLPFNFKNESEWQQAFARLGLSQLTVEAVRPYSWLPTRHRAFVLDIKGV